MKSLSSWRVSTRLQIMIGLTLLGLLILCFTALFQLKASMLEDRKQKTQNLVEVALGILAHQHKLQLDGKLSEEDAKTAAREALRELRYDTKDYYFVLDTNYAYVLMPPKPAMEGKVFKDMKDANGKPLIELIVNTAQKGGGFVDYHFARPGQETAEPKISYANIFAPWGWVVGTGIYIDDVEREFRKSAMLLGGISLVLLFILSVFGWLVSSSIARQLGGEPSAAAAVMQQVADGDLTASVGTPKPGSLLYALGSMVTALRSLVREINAGANSVVLNAEQIGHASREVATAAEHQTDATTSMAAAIEELTVSSSHISDRAQDTRKDSQESMTLAAEGSQRVEQAKGAIQKIATTVADASQRIHALEERANEVSSIANVIKGIAAQTNLLALNAAIEAARAGEMGRGFAVVADEVRKLAESTSAATIEIEQMIVGIQSDTVGAVDAMNATLPEVEHGVQLAESAAESLKAIELSSSRTLERIGEMSDATREQSAASTSIAQRVEQIAQMVEETTATIRGTSETAGNLEQTAQGLKSQIGRFKV
ncbi:methyl-accepting chemotaxis protein [Rhodocyclus tenuis]|uniref:Methyl-accepting chemotaxis protein n=1 Tax=Rhodocyclus tenuis TaxID=1066 RepID=A0A840G7P3_RHOTE|nr:methyl-accepting chemotaxis protein [Rhodocyclus tenuis]MBB4247905.1 methyl-accepting chemotaxis protein [Rhodocyclus tenuis]